MSRKPCLQRFARTARRTAARPSRIAAIGTLFLCFPLVAGGGERIGDVDVSIQPLPVMDSGASGFAQGTSHGYVEFRVKLRNLSAEERVVRLAIPPTRDGAMRRGVTLRRTVRVAGKQEAWVSLFQPPMQLAREDLEVSVEGVPRALRLNTRSLYQGHDYDEAPKLSVLLSRNVPREFRELGKPAAKVEVESNSRAGQTMSVTMVHPDDSVVFLRSEIAVSQWSPNWLGYSCYDGIVLTEKEFEGAGSQVRLALRRYVECGGTVLVHGSQVPTVLSRGGTPTGRETYRVGFGCAAASLAEGADWEATRTKLAKIPTSVYQPTTKPRNPRDLLVAEATVPVRGLFVLILLFGLIIGPANLWLLSRLKRRIWLWWNVPAISLATCLIVFVYSIVSEGIIGRGKQASVTLLDERCHRATTLGYLSYYCPLAPSTGLRFSVNTDVAMLSNVQVSPYRGIRNSDDVRVVDWTRGQYLASGWVKARVPTYFQIRKNEDRRERLTVERQAEGTLSVVNALGAHIDRLYWADQSGQVFVARHIPAGAERTLKAVPGVSAVKGEQTAVREIFRSSTHWLDDLQQWSNSDVPRKILSPGCYVAYLDESPFIEPALAGVDTTDSIAIVHGISKERDDGR